MSEMFSQGEIDRIIEDSWHEWQEQEPCDVYDEYGNYKYSGDVELTEPNTATSMPCEDIISRQAVNNLQKYRYCCGETAITCVSLASINRLPPVNPQPKTGHWIECEDEVKVYCSECKEISDYPTKFCPNCGAKMVEPQESEEQS